MPVGGAFSEVLRSADAHGQAVALKTARRAASARRLLADIALGRVQVLRTSASLHDRAPAGEQASCVAEAEREAHLLSLAAHANVLKVLQPPLGTASFALEWCDTDVAQARRRAVLAGGSRLD
jgi:hypothetical protein